MANRAMVEQLIKQVGDASYLFSYMSRAHTITKGEDPFYTKCRDTQATVLEILGRLIETLPHGVAGKADRERIEEVRDVQMKLGEMTADRVVGRKQTLGTERKTDASAQPYS